MKRTAWQLQVLDEQRELSQRLGKLHAFLQSADVPEAERLRLHAQLHIMQAYNDILAARILDWN